MRCPTCKELLDLSSAKFCPACGAAVEEPPPDPLVGQVIASRYKVTHLLAEGGMGRVYAAEQSMGASIRKVAIKVLLAEYSGRDQDVQRLARECSTVAELEHPNTIKFYDYGETREGDLFIAMEFLSGDSLAQVIKNGPMTPERVDLIVGQLCGSLYEAHTHGIVHRDLKPDNIILTSPGGAPDFVKVLDFGIAKRIGGKDPKLTPLGVVLGSPPYMSPEQFTMQEVDHRSDIYSLGVVAYQMLTGKLPFNATDPIEWAALHMGAQPAPIDSHGMPIPPTMRIAIERALSKEPIMRQSTMREFYTGFTIGAGSLEPGRMSSMVPLMSSQIPFPPPPKAPSSFPPNFPPGIVFEESSLQGHRSSDGVVRLVSVKASSIAPDRDPAREDRITQDAPLGRESEMPTHVRQDGQPSSKEEATRRDEPVVGASAEDEPATNVKEPTDEAPETARDAPEVAAQRARTDRGTSVMNTDDPSFAPPGIDPNDASPAPSPPAERREDNDAPTLRDVPSGPDISVQEISASQLSLTPSETASLKSGKGTIVMAASEPPPKKPLASLPELIPPTLRDPVSAVRNASRRTLVWIMLALVGIGAVASAIAWLFFLRPPPPKPKKSRGAQTSAVAGDRQTPPTSTVPAAATAGADSTPPTPIPNAPATGSSAPAADTSPKQPEKLSPCQTAIFAAVSGKCDLAQRAYARCADDSPYRASATRAISGLCP